VPQRRSAPGRHAAAPVPDDEPVAGAPRRDVPVAGAAPIRVATPVPAAAPAPAAAPIPVVTRTPGAVADLSATEPPYASRRGVRARARARKQPRTGPLSWLRETAVVLVSALILSLLVKTFLVQAFWIPSMSMHNTLWENDRILVSKLAPGPLQVHRGDIVVFKDPGGWLADQPATRVSGFQRVVNDALTFIGLRPVDAGEHLVKRVIGLPGDHVACAGPGAPITVNGVAIDEKQYLPPGTDPSDIAFSTTVPADSLWVMGDNRSHSEDSRYHMGNPGGGSIPVGNVVGVAFVIVWPVDHWAALRNPGAVFAGVPNPSS